MAILLVGNVVAVQTLAANAGVRGTVGGAFFEGNSDAESPDVP
jgi:hypothetical protein